jgi:hypothetical protein
VEVAFVSMELAGAGFFGALWLASVIWTVRDAGRRCSAPSLRLAAAAAAIFVPFVGAAVYGLARPCEDRQEARARRLRMRMLEGAFEPVERCPECAAPLEPDFRCCAVCGERVRDQCDGCGALVRTTWTVCAWCTKPLLVDEQSRLSEVA